MIGTLRRLRGRSSRELIVRATQFIHARSERLQLAWHGPVDFGTRPMRCEFSPPSRFLGTDDPSAVARAIAQADPELLARFQGQTERIHRGQIDVLGLGPLTAGNPPDWHCDASSGRVAPNIHWSRIPFLDPSVVGNHKVLWEINRHQYLYAPAFVWLVRGQARDFELVQRHLQDWLDRNPRWVGVNWASSLEVSYRAITWCWLIGLLRNAPWEPALKQRLLLSMEAHALHVERYLSTYFSPNTHLTGEALGLFYVGSLLRQSRHAPRLRSLGAKILEQSIRWQVHSDGVYFEQASLYQRYTTSPAGASGRRSANDWRDCWKFSAAWPTAAPRCR
jgi:hypothetical protein